MAPKTLRAGGALLAIGASLSALAACGGGSSSSSSASTAAPAATSGTMTMADGTTMATDGTTMGSTMGSTMDSGSTMGSTAMADGKAGFTKADDLRIALDRLLGEHMLLASDATQVALLGGKAFPAQADALAANTSDLASAIGSLYGSAAKGAFTAQWSAHNLDFVKYTQAAAKGDAAGKKAAVAALGTYQRDFGAFLGKATGLPVGAVQKELGMHVAHTAAVVDRFAAKDYAGSYGMEQTGYAHIGMLADTLAGAIATQGSLGATTGDAADLRARLDSLLAQHAFLALGALERAYDGAPDAKAATDALEVNTQALGELIGGAYGAAAKQTFLDQWHAHIGYLVSYTVGVAKKDMGAQDAAKKALDGYVAMHGAFLAKATGLPVDAVRAQLRMHVDELMATVDAYAAGRYAQAATGLRTAYAHMYETGDALAGGIIAVKGLS